MDDRISTSRTPGKSLLSRTEAVQIDPNQRTELVGLDMSSFKIRHVPLSLFAFNFLSDLRLSNNALQSLPADIGRLKSLVRLDVSNNRLKSLPKQLGWCTALRELLLFNNQLPDLPVELGFLFQLETLGLDGNPLVNDAILNVLHASGPLSIIQFMRDHMLHLNPPAERLWHTIESFMMGAHTFTVLSYNVLSDKYATTQMFGYVPSWYLNWEYRKLMIVHEIASYDPDIVCLQEVEASQFERFFKDQFKMRGNYEGVFSPKSRAKTMNEWDRPFVDGCAVFYKQDKFKLAEKYLIEFNQLALARPSLRKHKDMYNRVMTKDNISVAVRLEHLESRHELVVGNVHIHWDPSFKDVKLVQVIMLVEELEKICQRHQRASLILCGDFNSLHESGVYQFIDSGSIQPNHQDFGQFTYEPYSNEGAGHQMALKDVYAQCPDPPEFTNYTSTFDGVIDYIFYRPGQIAVTGMLGGIQPEYAKQVPGFPTQHYPSDHLALMAEFRIDPSGSYPASSSSAQQPSRRPNNSNSGEDVGRRLFSRKPQ